MVASQPASAKHHLGPGGDIGVGTPQKPIQSPDRLHKAPTDHKAPTGFTRPRNIRQNLKILNEKLITFDKYPEYFTRVTTNIVLA